VKRALQWSLYAQAIVAIVVMIVGFQRTEPQEFNWAATIIVAPLYGMGLNGVWVSMYGTFGPRIVAPRAPGKRRSKRAAGDS
jgi:energy-converting hydrogenase Eha subunit A